MAYATYTTQAIVCGSRDSYTSDRSYLLFTKDAGMLWANARSVREEKSKQRYALQDFSSIRVSLVKGKTGWRIGSVEALGNAFLNAKDRQQRGLVSYAVTQLRRYVHGEVALPSVYEDTLAILTAPQIQQSSVIQSVFLLRLLTTLGYVAPSAQLQEHIVLENIEEAWKLCEEELVPVIEKALVDATHASHL